MADDLLELVRGRLAARGDAVSRDAVARVVRELPGVRGEAEVDRVTRSLQDEAGGAGPLQPLLADPAVTDVLVQRGGEVWVDRGAGLVREPWELPDEAAVRRLAVRMVAAAGRRLDTAQPWADAALPDGHRVHAVLPPVAVDGTALSLRVLRPVRWDLDALAAAGALPAPLPDWLRAVVTARLSVLVTGATGSGKTTLLGALLGGADAGDRIVVVEDATELAPVHPHVVRLQARPPNVEGVGAVPLRDLVRQALRMRPDRLVVGEVRGAEVVDLLVALNTGHEGSLSTLHANSPAEVSRRLEALGALADLPRDAVHSLAAGAVQVVVHCLRTPTGRGVAAVGVVDTDRDGVVVRTALTTDGDRVRPGPALPALRRLLAARGVAGAR